MCWICLPEQNEFNFAGNALRRKTEEKELDIREGKPDTSSWPFVCKTNYWKSLEREPSRRPLKNRNQNNCDRKECETTARRWANDQRLTNRKAFLWPRPRTVKVAGQAPLTRLHHWSLGEGRMWSCTKKGIGCKKTPGAEWKVNTAHNTRGN